MKDLTKNRWKFVLIPALIVIAGIVPVSYTHLDVYKRQAKVRCPIHRYL